MKSLKLVILFLFSGIFSYAQLKNPSKDLSYKALNDSIKAFVKSNEKRRLYTEAYLTKAINNNDSIHIGKAYRFYARTIKSFPDRLSYYDSAIHYTEKLKDTLYPAVLYLEKGAILHYQRKYEGALDNYLLADKALKHPGSLLFYDIKFNIGFIQRIIGNYEAALKSFNECMLFEEKKAHLNNGSRYLDALFQVSNVYREMKQYHKSTLINKQGIQSALNRNLINQYYVFVCNQGENLTQQGNYTEAIDSLEKALPHLRSVDQTMAQFYLGKSYHALGQKKKAIVLFKKVDSAFIEKSSLLLQIRETYDFLIQHAKEKNNDKLELYYTNQLLKLDSTYHSQFKNLSKTITKKYDIPKLIENRERLIFSLEKDKQVISKKLNITFILGATLSLLLLVGLIYYYRLKHTYKKRYEQISKKNEALTQEITNVTQITESEKDSIGLDDASIQTLLKKLEVFENEKHYLTNQITLQDASKIMETNSKYLSKVINTYKGKSFITYINDLRVDYLIDHIKNDPLYKKYTIKAIAQEGGFTNSGAFFRAFHKKTGLKPSYFIKKTREEEQK